MCDLLKWVVLHVDAVRRGRSLTGVPYAAVTLDDKKLAIHEGQNELEVIPYVERGEFLLLWQKHREGLGNSVELTTGGSLTCLVDLHLVNVLCHDIGFTENFSCLAMHGPP